MIKLFTRFLLVVLIISTASAMQTETGTLRGMLMGRCAGCAYDNWVSHVTEGVARPGYNDFGPSWYDPQKNGFGHFNSLPKDAGGDEALAEWRDIFDFAVNNQWPEVDSILLLHRSDWRYSLVQLSDTSLNSIFYLLREELDSSFVDSNVVADPNDDVIGSFQNGWGIFVFNPASTFPKLIVETPHPEDDFLAVPLGIEFFLLSDARQMMIAGSSRETLWDTTQANYTNGSSISDPSRNSRTPYAVCHESLFDHLDGGPTSQMVTLNFHSYDHLLHYGRKNVQVTAFADDNRPNPPLRDRAEHQDLIHFIGRQPVSGLTGYPAINCAINQYLCLQSYPAYSYYGTTDTIPISNSLDLPGFPWNQQALYSHRSHNVDVDPENFIHMEFDEYPENLWSPVQWHQWLPGTMPPTMETFALALEYYGPFLAALDSSLRYSHLYPDTTAPVVVHITKTDLYSADSVRITWTPAATDRFFDTYLIYYDTANVTTASPYLTRTRSGMSTLVDFNTKSILLTSLPLHANLYHFTVAGRDIYSNISEMSNPSKRFRGIVSLRPSDSYLGCVEACRADTLQLSFGEIGYRSGQMFVILPAELKVAWPDGNVAYSVFPATNIATNLVFSTARRVGSATSDTIEINIQWSPPYSDGNSARNIASIPFRNEFVTLSDTLTIIGGDSTVFHDNSGNHINDIYVGSTTVYTDCVPPAVAFTYLSAPTCAFGSASALQGLMSLNALRGTIPPAVELASAYVEVNGDPLKRVTLFSSLLPGNYTNSTFPGSAESLALWSYLNEGCNQLVFHAFDRECNEGISASLVMAKDITAPSITIVNQPMIYSQNTYPVLADSFRITALLGANCISSVGTLKIWYDSGLDTITLPLDVTGFPADLHEAESFWDWIVHYSDIPATANGESYTFHTQTYDCAGNVRDTTFSLLIDLTLPVNTVTAFDARPTHLGVWLYWVWDKDIPPASAVSMEIWRSPYIDGDQPEYASPNPGLWQNLADSVFYPRTYPPEGWTKVVHQDGITGSTSLLYTGLNGKGINLHSEANESYWLDADSGWTDGTPQRDIYRYITFVKDAAGNWSCDTVFSLNRNADRATNYWLGDFIPADTVGTPASAGRVNSEDLGALAAHYFSNTEPAWAYLDIGPEYFENDLGKGIPIPDGVIDFFDLLPFSDNYGVASPVGLPGEFRLLQPSHNRIPRRNLDEGPTITLSSKDDGLIAAGESFCIQLELLTRGGKISISDAELAYDPNILEIVSIQPADIHAIQGIPFIKAAPIDGKTGRVGAVAAALGVQGFIREDLALATVEFRWKNMHVGTTQIELTSARMVDETGAITEQSGSTLQLSAIGIIPATFALYQNYPNPFNPDTRIRFDLPVSTEVQLTIYNLLGQQVRTLVSGSMEAGSQSVIWNGTDGQGQSVGSGMYLYRLKAGTYVNTKKLLLTR